MSVVRKDFATLLMLGLITFALGERAFAADSKHHSLPPFLALNCVDCHQGADADGGLDLTKLTRNLDDPFTHEKWVRIVDRVESGEMPPADSGEVDPAERKTFVSAASKWLVSEQQKQYNAEGRVPLRRLTHAQVERTLHDLLAIDMPLATQVPNDPRTDGYTTIADGQPMSHFQMQSHLTIVDSALDFAFDRVTRKEDTKQRRFSAKDIARTNPKRRCREPEMIGDVAVTWSSGLIFYGRLPITTAREAGWYKFTVKASAVNQPQDHGVWCTVRSGKCVSSAPLLAWVSAFEATKQPNEWSFTAWLPKGHMLEIRPGDQTIGKARFEGGQVGVGEGGPQDVPGVALHSMTMEQIFPGGTVADVRKAIFGEAASVFDPANKKQTWVDEARSRVDQQLAAFAERAFRRPVEAAQWQPYAKLFHDWVREGESPLEALQACYRAILCSPRFLYFQEAPGELDTYAVASRVSYFITGSAPDRELLKRAESGELTRPAVLQNEVTRLLETPRGKGFVDRFAGEWLDLVDIEFTEPDPKLYREFDQIVQHTMLAETRTYLNDMLKRNASIAELIDSDYTYANSRLARYYELSDDVDTDELRRVRLRDKDRRGGLMAQGAILKVTANGTNTSPVVRGVWLSRKLLGVTIPPPPMSVPAIEPDVRGATTIRDQLEKHRSDVNCASCHSKIDPAGFALEKFDAAGQWREKYLKLDKGKLRPGVEIDTSYVLADGRAFNDFQEFQSLISADARPIARNFVEHLLAYGTGTFATFADRQPIADVVDRCESENYGIKSLLVATVTSPTFLRK